jgi:hypothetical protein
MSLIALVCYGSHLIALGVANPDILSSSFYAFYVGMGARSLIQSYNEIIKAGALYEGLHKHIGTCKKNNKN